MTPARPDDLLLAFEANEQRRAAERVGRAVVDGVVTNIRALYDDRVHLPSDWVPAFHRNGTPLSALPFLARRVVAFISPKKRESVEHDLRTPWPIALELARAGILIPIVAWPRDYSTPETEYLRPLFDGTIKTTISMPARGYKMVEVMGANKHFDAARRDVRISELAALPLLRSKWSSQFPVSTASEDLLGERVLVELHNNYVDLCIFGYEDLAHAALDEPDPVNRAAALLQSSELLTYPSLIGLDGRPHYRARSDGVSAHLFPELLPEHVSLPIMEAILHGVDLDLAGLLTSPDKYLQAVQRVHEAGVVGEIESLHSRLFDSIDEHTDLDDSSLNATARDLMDSISVAKQELAAVAPTISSNATKSYHKLAALGIGGSGLLASVFAKQFGQAHLEFAVVGASATAVAAAYVKERIPYVREFLVKRAAHRALHKPLAFDLWRIRSRLGK